MTNIQTLFDLAGQYHCQVEAEPSLFPCNAHLTPPSCPIDIVTLGMQSHSIRRRCNSHSLLLQICQGHDQHKQGMEHDYMEEDWHSIVGAIQQNSWLIVCCSTLFCCSKDAQYTICSRYITRVYTCVLVGSKIISKLSNVDKT